MASAKTVLRSKPDLKEAGINLVEAGAFGGFIVATDFIDEQMVLNQDTLKSVSNAAPIAISLISTAGAAMTKGGTQKGMRDVQLMSTPFAIVSVTRVLRARGVFGKLWKKKAHSNRVDNHPGYGHKHNNIQGVEGFSASEMSFSGLDAA